MMNIRNKEKMMGYYGHILQYDKKYYIFRHYGIEGAIIKIHKTAGKLLKLISSYI